MKKRQIPMIVATAGMVVTPMIAQANTNGNITDPDNPRRYSHKVQVQQPNLLYIFPDQFRYSALSLWSDPEYQQYLRTAGDPVQTPNLDRLAREGVIFTDACSTYPVSSPHRAMFMSGMYPSRNGVQNNCYIGRKEGLHPEIECFTDVLAAAGWETAYVGKTHWHKTEALFDKNGNYVGTAEAPGGEVVSKYDTYIPEGPSRHGNKYWFQGLKGHFQSITYSNRPELVDGRRDGEICHREGFTAANEADVVIRYLENKNGERRKNRPFSIIWAINPPHPPYTRQGDCDQEVFNALYKDMPVEELLVRENAHPQWVDEKGKKHNIRMTARVYFSLIKSVDEAIGRVLDALDATGEADRTIVVFTSDHGEMMGSHDMTGKNKMYEESFRVPYIVRYPDKLHHQINDLTFGSVDIMPTLLGLMGLGDRIPESVMGCDYSDGILTGTFTKHPKPETALFLNPQSKGVRSAVYTYVVYKNGEYDLYDNVKDPYQMNSLGLEDIPVRDVHFLQEELGRWLKVAEDPWAAKTMHSELIRY